jgi:hypothetical protein
MSCTFLLFFPVFANQNPRLRSAFPRRCHSSVTSEIPSSQTFQPLNLPTFKHTPCRHRDDNPVTPRLLFLPLTNRDASISFRIRFYENCRVAYPHASHFGTQRPSFPFNQCFDVETFRQGLDLSLFFSYSCALFCTTAVSQLFCKQLVTHSFYRNGGVPPCHPFSEDQDHSRTPDSCSFHGALSEKEICRGQSVPNRTDDYTPPHVYSHCGIPSLRPGDRRFPPFWRSS